KNKNKKKPLYLLIGAPVVGAIILLMIVVSYGIYSYHWQGSFTYNLTRLVPYPAIFVDWEVISYHTYLDDLKTMEKYWANQRANINVFLGIPENAEIRERLVDKLVEEKIIQIWARQNNLAVTPEEVLVEWERLQTKEGDRSQIKQFLNKAYGWTENQFKDRVLYPFLLEQKVKAILVKNNNSEEPVLKKRADEIFSRTQEPGIIFSELANKYSDDRVSARQGGDLGYFSRNTFEPQIEQAIFSMKIGDISQPLKSSFGYQIIQLNDLLSDDAGTATQASISHILVKSFNFDEWLEQQKNKLAIYRLVL
ncbi:MAG: peptidylprolyl isomerase, partial [Candidatus Komeilibacteria bacterium]|nr:peptidylprolyl isomerase [Candidatus Komeilibacteria bacterium]